MNSRNDVCRLCDKQKHKMCSVFSKNDKGQQILQLIKECLPIIIFRTDPLSKQICLDCLNELEVFHRLKRTSLDTAEKHINHLRNTNEKEKSLQLYLACEQEELNEVLSNSRDIPEKITQSISTEDLKLSCRKCKSESLEATLLINTEELELCAEVNVLTDSIKLTDAEKGERSRRKRSQAFYHELDDSLCSSLTDEYTNTESSHYYEDYHSEIESCYSPTDLKRRKIEEEIPEAPVIEKNYKEIYGNDLEYRYVPLSLMRLALNAINKRIVPGYEPDDFYEKVCEPQCRYCGTKFKNAKLLALHEIEHINIELGDKVDAPLLWHESRDDAEIRNKWLNSYDETDGDESTYMECEVETAPGESLLIPIATEGAEDAPTTSDIVLIMGEPHVNNIALTDYSKDERKHYYKSMKIGGVNKKFCPLCRYSFKDNWAIESHYFSLACYYTCRYCGMRFNKQRHRFEEHVLDHERQGDQLSTKIYAASKLNNFVPRIIQPEKVKKMVAQHELPHIRPAGIKVKSFAQRKSIQTDIKIKEEKFDSDEEQDGQEDKKQPSPATKNQAYFCRKCYKVFFKLDEFNVHSKNCDYNQFPQNRNVNNKAVRPNNSKNSSSNNTPNGDSHPAARPVRNSTREAIYKEENVENSHSQQSFICFICNTPFPTIYSRNSHMRIHKGERNHKSPVMKPRFEPTPQSPPFIKQEPLEPEIQIHEAEPKYEASNSIGAVSITPISKNPNQKATINPNIMKLVQNNPHLTIRANASPERQLSISGNNSQNEDKTYKCSSCWEAFTNKSHLYFHKKNQCEGSKYPCPFCKKRFGTEAAYSSHIFYSHPE